MAEIKYEIVQEICVLSESARGWTKELNLVSWNDREPKFDIREWAPEHSRMGKGVTLSKEEMQMKCPLNPWTSSDWNTICNEKIRAAADRRPGSFLYDGLVQMAQLEEREDLCVSA